MTKTARVVTGLAGMLIAGSAYAGAGPGVLPGIGGTSPIFSSYVTNNFDYNSVALHLPVSPSQGGSPVAQQFTVSAPTTIDYLDFRLADSTPSDGGSIMVYLAANGIGNAPLSNGLTLTNPTYLGTIADSSLSSTASNVGLSVYDNIAAGTYWIALIGTTTTQNAVWYRANDFIGLDVGNNVSNTTAGLYNVHVAPGGTSLASLNNTIFEMQIDAPEPASMALFGAGIFGLGVVQRRRAKKSAG